MGLKLKPSLRMVALDLSPNRSAGIYIEEDWDDKEREQFFTSPAKTLIDKGGVFLPPFSNEMEQIEFCKSEMAKWMGTYRPDVVSIENYAFSKFETNKACFIAEFTGAFKLWLWNQGIPYKTYSPGQIKKFATGIGKGPKSTVMLGVYKRWGIDYSEYGKSGEDLADAYAMVKLLQFEMRIRAGIPIPDEKKILNRFMTKDTLKRGFEVKDGSTVCLDLQSLRQPAERVKKNHRSK